MESSKFLNVDVDNTLGGVNTSHQKVASQRAIKEYVDGNLTVSKRTGRDQYRTWTKEEWTYLVSVRSASTVLGVANARFAPMRVNDVNGVTIFPDSFSFPTGTTISSGVATLPNGSTVDYYTINDGALDLAGMNAINTADWTLLEQCGAVFIPVAGIEYAGQWYSNAFGYWTVSANVGQSYVEGYITGLTAGGTYYYVYSSVAKISVRLLDTSRTGFSISATESVDITRSNLQFNPAKDEWRFAPNAWDFMFDRNDFSNKYNPNYDGWIDHFSFGTSGWDSGAEVYQPWVYEDNVTKYIQHDLTGSYANADWGVWITNEKIDTKPILDIVFSGGEEEVQSYDRMGISYVWRNFDSCSVSLEALYEAVNNGTIIRVTEDGYNSFHRQVNNELVLANFTEYLDDPEYKKISVELRTVPQVGEDREVDVYYYLDYESGSDFESRNMFRQSNELRVSRVGRSGYYEHLNSRPNFESTVSVLDELQFSGSIQSPWRTMTREEWMYLLFNRDTTAWIQGYGGSNPRFAKALVGSDATPGLIIFPDTGGIYTTVVNVNESEAEFSDNSFSASDWSTYFEPVGCVFLPVTGVRVGTSIDSSVGVYHTSTNYNSNNSYEFRLSDRVIVTAAARSRGRAVRLVHDSLIGKFSVGVDQESARTVRKVSIATSNLQYHCLNKEWRFATNPWDFIGNGNANISQNYNGWIDLFGYGTSGWNSGYNVYQPWSTSTTNSDYINHDLVNEWKNADWYVFALTRQFHKLAFSGDYSDLENVPLGEPNGIAQLDSGGKIPSSQLPSYVDDVIEGYLYNNHFYVDQAHTTLVDNDQTEGKIYVDLSDDKTYRWSGSTYIEISKSLVLGTSHTTAFYGDYGQTAYNHATDANRVTTAQSSGLYKIAVTSEGHVASVTSVVASDIPTQDATETQKGVAELATSAEAITGTDTERIMTPKTNRDAHDAWHWFGTQAEFDALEQGGQLNEDVIYHVEMEYSIPQPTAQDEGKLLSVNSLGQYELVTIVNSELQPY